jgi:hypothetical protein
MSHLLVFATAESRLHADLMVVRLKRAGIDTDLVSILHPPAARPNCALCWLDGASSVPLSSGGAAIVSGLFRLSLADPRANGGSATLADRLCLLGMGTDQGLYIEERLHENRIVILVEVYDEIELPVIIHTFRGLASEKAHAVDLNWRNAPPARGPARQGPAPSRPHHALSHAVAAA